MSVLRWEEPGAPNKWKRYVSELQSRPGEWALIAEGVTGLEAESGRTSLWRYGCQVSRRKVDGKGYSIYARWPA